MHLKHFLTGLIMLSAGFMSGSAWAQNSASVNQAFQVARQAVNPEIQTKVVSVYGVGTPTAILKWYIIFYDAGVPSHGRAVLVENSQITKTYVANGGTTYSAGLTFDPSHISSEGPALSAAQGYAAQHHIVYDSVTALLKETSANKPFRWKVGLLNDHKVRGYVMVNALDASVADYVSPTQTSRSDGDSARGFAHDVKSTFLGIGGDLEEFFTGDRTVDK